LFVHSELLVAQPVNADLIAEGRNLIGIREKKMELRRESGIGVSAALPSEDLADVLGKERRGLRTISHW